MQSLPQSATLTEVFFATFFKSRFCVERLILYYNGDKMRYILLVVLLFGAIMLQGITVSELEREQNRGNLIVGRGIGTTEAEADKNALRDLVSQIVVEVKSSFVSIAKESNFEVEDYCKSVVETFSDVKLGNASKYVDRKSSSGELVVYRYITPEDKDRLFRERKTEILSFVSEGELAESSDNAVDAIRNYYWALMLLKTHPEGKTMKYYFLDQERVLASALVNQIEKILSKIEISITSIKDVKGSNCFDYILSSSYKGVATDGILIKYFNGNQWSAFERWSSGKGYFNIKKSMAKTMEYIELEIDCSFSEHGFKGDIANTLSSMKGNKFNKSQKKIWFSKKGIEKVEKSLPKIADKSEISAEMVVVLEKVISAITTKDLGQSRRYFTTKGFDEFNDLLGYGNAKILPEKITFKVVEIGDLRIVRSLPVKFDFSSSRESFTERVNLVFNRENKIEGVTFSLSDRAVEDIMTKDYGTEQDKALIMNFVEQYKTAYCLKNIDYIKDVFSKDALIIVGRAVKREPDKVLDSMYKQLSDEKIEYITLNKDEYIGRLQEQFGKKEFINIHFTENQIDKVSSSDKKIYGMQIGQYYYSSDYSDQGYLFLMFDLTNPDKPKIMVRSWQPEKAADGSIIGVSNFEFD